MKEYDVVRVTRLKEPSRSFDGSAHSRRPPQVGDTGAIVHRFGSGRSAVESVDDDGFTVWLADFDDDELEITVEV